MGRGHPHAANNKTREHSALDLNILTKELGRLDKASVPLAETLQLGKNLAARALGAFGSSGAVALPINQTYYSAYH